MKHKQRYIPYYSKVNAKMQRFRYRLLDVFTYSFAGTRNKAYEWLLVLCFGSFMWLDIIERIRNWPHTSHKNECRDSNISSDDLCLRYIINLILRLLKRALRNNTGIVTKAVNKRARGESAQAWSELKQYSIWWIRIPNGFAVHKSRGWK